VRPDEEVERDYQGHLVASGAVKFIHIPEQFAPSVICNPFGTTGA